MVLLITDTGISRYFTLKGIPNVEPIYEEKIDANNTLVIDSSFHYDITLSFKDYIFGIFKIINNYSTSKRDKIFSYNTEFYKKPFDKDTYKDLVIMLRKEAYKKVHVPNITSDGKIRISQLRVEDVGPNIIDWKAKVKDYEKLRITIFNETILPYIKRSLY